MRQEELLMRIRRAFLSLSVILCALLASATNAQAQYQASESPWFVDLAVGIAPSINGNVNSGGIGVLQGQAAAILPNPYGDVYGTGIDFRFGGGYMLNDESELRGIFTYQSADADLVRLGDIGPSSLYGQYSDYKSLGLDFGYRRYVPLSIHSIRPYGEVTLGVAFIDRINIQLAAPQSNIVFNNTDFYDGTAAFTWGINGGVVFHVAEQTDVTAQLGLRHVSGLADVDQLVGTGLEEINNDSGRLTFPIVVGVRFRFK
jgi:Outer membrane protein beta-barrel domain